MPLNSLLSVNVYLSIKIAQVAKKSRHSRGCWKPGKQMFMTFENRKKGFYQIDLCFYRIDLCCSDVIARRKGLVGKFDWKNKAFLLYYLIV